MATEMPSRGRLAGIDYGTVRIGVAISNPDQTLASPWENYTRGDEKQDRRFFERLIECEEVVGFVVGLPYHLSGDDSQKTVEARRFGQWLAGWSKLPVCFFDERFTTAFAEELLADSGLTRQQRKKRLDKLAAQILLSAYLESQTRREDRQPLDG